MSPFPTATVTTWMRDFSCFSRFSASHSFSTYFSCCSVSHASQLLIVSQFASQLLSFSICFSRVLRYSASHATQLLMLLSFTYFSVSRLLNLLLMLLSFLCFSRFEQCAQFLWKGEASTLHMLSLQMPALTR
jgi:hypothetical protein